jgi:hypothetical protein
MPNDFYGGIPPLTPHKPAPQKADLARGDIRKIWAQHGGTQHGPRVETMTIPEADFFAFVTEILDIERTKRADMTEFCTSIARELDIMLEVEF